VLIEAVALLDALFEAFALYRAPDFESPPAVFGFE
jgi:hypothetical protein